MPTRKMLRTRRNSYISVYSESGASENTQSYRGDSKSIKFHELNEFGYCDETNSRTWGSWEGWDTSSESERAVPIKAAPKQIQIRAKVNAEEKADVASCRMW